MNYTFPFGKQLTKVEQKDKTPKKAFVLGVYASAIHAKWIDKNGKQKVLALAIASEPEIFWTGSNAEQIIASINIPSELGKLTITNKNLNGPSGRSLDEKFLAPLNLNRQSTWLCDLLPESRVNEKQRLAIDKHYSADLIKEYNLPAATIPNFDKKELDSEIRRKQILQELKESQADTLILLGDLPIYWFLQFHDKRYSRLAQFGTTNETYGREHNILINNKVYKVIPLCHPRQADALGHSNAIWRELHDNWIIKKRSKEQMKKEEFHEKVLSKYKKQDGTVTNDITDRVFLMIENDAELLKDYQAHVGGKNMKVKNGRIAKAIKAEFNLENDKICKEPKSSLIKSYMLFKNKTK